MGFDDLVSKMNEKNQFEKVCVDQGVIDSVVFYSKKSYPNEFLAMFDGYVNDKVLYITGLLFLPGERSHTSATFNDWMIPPSQKKWGSVHSHPGSNASPSHADLITFSKHGPFHIIVCEPYSLETMKAYDSYGMPTTFEVGHFSDEHEDRMLEDLAEIKEEIDEMYGKDLSPSFFDLDKDLSYFNDDREKTNKYSHEFADGSDLNIKISSDSNIKISSDSNIKISSDSYSSNTSYNPYNVSDDDLGAIDLNPKVVEIGGERINGQSPKLGLVIEFRDGKPILKGFTNRHDEDDNLDEE